MRGGPRRLRGGSGRMRGGSGRMRGGPAVVAMDLRVAFRVGLLFTASANAGQRDESLLGDMDADSTES